jgi:hypothetical protein
MGKPHLCDTCHLEVTEAVLERWQKAEESVRLDVSFAEKAYTTEIYRGNVSIGTVTARFTKEGVRVTTSRARGCIGEELFAATAAEIAAMPIHL